MQRQGGLAARLGAVDLGDAPAGNAAHADGRIQVDRPGRDEIHPNPRFLPHSHDRALAEVLLDLRDGEVDRFLLLLGNLGSVGGGRFLSRHGYLGWVCVPVSRFVPTSHFSRPYRIYPEAGVTATPVGTHLPGARS